MTADRIHDLLPWFVNGTLEPAEAEAFERHLMDCADCRKELDFLRKLQRELQTHGDDLLADHPAAEQVVALCIPGSTDVEITEEEATRLKRHLALCATCAEEARWLTGEATAATIEPLPTAKRFRAVWAAAAVFAIALALTPLLLRDATDRVTGSFVPRLLEETRRGAGPVEVPVAPGVEHVFLLLPVDLDPTALPVDLEIVDAGHRNVHRESIRADDLHDERFLFFALPRRDLPDGDYVAHLRGTDPAAHAEYRFRVVTATPRDPIPESR